jgi:hypothetical protein
MPLTLLLPPSVCCCEENLPLFPAEEIADDGTSGVREKGRRDSTCAPPSVVEANDAAAEVTEVAKADSAPLVSLGIV